MIGVVHQLPLYAFLLWTGTLFFVYYSKFAKVFLDIFEGVVYQSVSRSHTNIVNRKVSAQVTRM